MEFLNRWICIYDFFLPYLFAGDQDSEKKAVQCYSQQLSPVILDENATLSLVFNYSSMKMLKTTTTTTKPKWWQRRGEKNTESGSGDIGHLHFLSASLALAPLSYASDPFASAGEDPSLSRVPPEHQPCLLPILALLF